MQSLNVPGGSWKPIPGASVLLIYLFTGACELCPVCKKVDIACSVTRLALFIFHPWVFVQFCRWPWVVFPIMAKLWFITWIVYLFSQVAFSYSLVRMLAISIFARVRSRVLPGLFSTSFQHCPNVFMSSSPVLLMQLLIMPWQHLDWGTTDPFFQLHALLSAAPFIAACRVNMPLYTLAILYLGSKLCLDFLLCNVTLSLATCYVVRLCFMGASTGTRFSGFCHCDLGRWESSGRAVQTRRF